MKYACALIAVEDVKRSRAFYEGILGQEVEADFGENVGYKGGFSIMQKALWSKVLRGASVASRPNDHELYFEDDDVDGCEARLEAAGIEFLHGAVEQPWRQKVLRCYDPDGHIVEIGETMPRLVRRLAAEGGDAAAISKMTGMAIEMVEGFLRS
jgi:catechol 2,3-dioxygenase-like lactoylglutathione lyase family enzyme